MSGATENPPEPIGGARRTFHITTTAATSVSGNAAHSTMVIHWSTPDGPPTNTRPAKNASTIPGTTRSDHAAVQAMSHTAEERRSITGMLGRVETPVVSENEGGG